MDPEEENDFQKRTSGGLMARRRKKKPNPPISSAKKASSPKHPSALLRLQKDLTDLDLPSNVTLTIQYDHHPKVLQILMEFFPHVPRPLFDIMMDYYKEPLAWE